MAATRTVEREGLTMRLRGESPVVLEFQGSLREPDPRAWLEPLLDELGQRARQEGSKTVCFDWSALSYMNATAFREIVGWLRKFLEGENDRDVLLVCNDKEMWQSMFVSTLRMVVGQGRLRVGAAR